MYPPFLFIGANFVFDVKRKAITIRIPLRWYTRNNNSALFGGAICAAADPFPALFLQQLIPGTSAWTKDIKVEYLKPVRSEIISTIVISDGELEVLKRAVEQNGNVEKRFEYHFCNSGNEKVARITTAAYLRRQHRRPNVTR